MRKTTEMSFSIAHDSADHFVDLLDFLREVSAFLPDHVSVRFESCKSDFGIVHLTIEEGDE